MSSKTFGQRCSLMMLQRQLISSEHHAEISKIIDDERAAVIARAAAATTPAIIDHSDPRLAGATATEDFGDRKKVPPTHEQVAAYSRSLGTEIDGHAFCDHYEMKGWVVGRVKMKDWQAAARRAIKEGYFINKAAKMTSTGPRKFY